MKPWVKINLPKEQHCVKSVRIRSYFGPRFPSFGLNTERCSISLYIQSEWGKMRTRITPNTDTFYAVWLTSIRYVFLYIYIYILYFYIYIYVFWKISCVLFIKTLIIPILELLLCPILESQINVPLPLAIFLRIHDRLQTSKICVKNIKSWINVLQCSVFPLTPYFNHSPS